MELIEKKLPSNFSKTIHELARTREKSAKQKYLLDLGESLVMHLSGFLLAEYKECGAIHIDLEKDFLKNNKNLSFGIYLQFIRKTGNFLHQIGKDSKIHQLLLGKNEIPEIGQFIKAYAAIKDVIDNQKEQSLKTAADLKANENSGKLNLLDFFNSFIEIRNRVAHPHKEVKGKHISWPFNEDYFDSINSYIEKALYKAINLLASVWEFKFFTINDVDDDTIMLESDDGEITQITGGKNLEKGLKVIVNENNNLLIFDWKLLLKAGPEAIEAIKKEEEELRQKASIESLKEAILSALDDQQISMEELNFFESLGKTKLNLSKNDIRNLIQQVAISIGIEDPFPEVDKRFVEIIDQAINTKTYNEFLLKLTGQQYGVDAAMFEKLFLERTFALNVDPEEIKKNKVLQFSSEEINDVFSLLTARNWITNIALFNKLNKESQFKIVDDSYKFGTKEYWHRTSFKAVETFVKNRIKKLAQDADQNWDWNQNNWQIGAMTSYAWCSVFPKNFRTKRILALNLTFHSDSVFTGFLPDWKDYKIIENYGLLRDVFVLHLKEFAKNYATDLAQYPNLKVWDDTNNFGRYSLLEISEKYEWYLDHLYYFNMIQFVNLIEEVNKNPLVIINNFDIAFNLFSGIFEGVNRDYTNMLDNKYLIDEHEEMLKNKLSKLNSLLEEYGLLSVTPTESKTSVEEEKKDEQGGIENNAVLEEENSKGISGNAKTGTIYISVKEKLKGYPLQIHFVIKQNYLTNELIFSIKVNTAGYREPEIHEKVEKVLQQLMDVNFENTDSYFLRSHYVLVQKITDIVTYDPLPLVKEFLQQISEKCAFAYTEFLLLKINNPTINNLLPAVNNNLNTLNTEHVSKLISNKVHNERNLMKGYRYLDYVYSTKKVYHWFGWGLEYKNNHLYAGIIYHVANSLTGIAFKEKMDSFIQANEGWELVALNNSSLQSDAKWIFPELNQNQLSSSSNWNRNYVPKFAIIDGEKQYWCPKESNDKQWLQISFDEPKELLAMKLQGSPNGKNYITEFVIDYSLDGKTWSKTDAISCLNTGNELKEISFDKSIKAKLFKIQPTKFVGFPGLRMDIFVQNIVPAKLELKYMQTINDEGSVNTVFTKIQENISLLYNHMKSISGF
jgi:hypothetical protein